MTIVNRKLAVKRLPYTATPEERFWSFVDKSAGENGCWIWKGSLDTNGYGGFTAKRRRVKSNRFAWELTRGEIPEGLHVLHECDRRSCVNPSHLWLGTHAENMADKARKGRVIAKKGVENSNAKLNETQVREIRQLRLSGISLNQLAKKFNVSKKAILMIVQRKNWKHILD